MEKIIITIDGPAASGKTSVSRGLAHKLNYEWESTGAFYRGIAYLVLINDIDPTDPSAILELCKKTDWKVIMDKENTLFLINGKDHTKNIFDVKVGDMASKVSPHPEVRDYLLGAQRDLVELIDNGLVAEGRDCGTVVYPQAKYKFYLTADQEKRAQRRAEEKGENVEKVLQAQNIRDKQDSSRKSAPLQVPEGAIVVDTTDLNLDEVIEKIFSQV